MDRVFACPKCGSELKARRLRSGRHVRCDWCEASVEVPFFPRESQKWPGRRGRRGLPWYFWGWGFVGIVALMVLALGTTRWVQSRTRSVREHELSGLLDAAAADEKEGRLSEAVSELEGALSLLRQLESPSSARIQELTTRRDALVCREARALLDKLKTLQAAEVVKQCLQLLARSETQPALAEFEGEIQEYLQDASRLTVREDLSAAARAFDVGKAAEAVGLCERIDRYAEHLDPRERRQAREDVKALVARIAERYGVVLEPIRGVFIFGSPASYTETLEPVVADALKLHGYSSCPQSSTWRTLWDEKAPFRMAIEMTDYQLENYLQSHNRVSMINAKLTLKQQSEILWERFVNARTQVPVPKLPAYQASRIAVGDKPVPEFERVLYQNAQETFYERFGAALRTIPDRPESGPPANRSSSLYIQMGSSIH